MKEKVLEASQITSLGVGAPRRLLFPSSYDELLLALEMGALPIGGGSNSVLLETDRPLLSLEEFKRVELEGGRVTLGAGVKLKELLKLQIREGFSLFEFLAGVPRATVGGLVAQNAGAFGKEVSQFLESLVYISWEGEILELKDFNGFGYRSSPFPKLGVVLEATFRVERRPGIFREVERFVRERLERHPPFFLKTAGSTFKNPPGESAGKLLELCGMKGYRVGGLKFSEKHANFLLNFGGTLEDFFRITDEAKERVFREFGVELSLEVRLI